VLPAVARAVNGRVPIIFDSGVRRGQDVVKAIASGADVVAIGRPVIYGLALGGWQGVRSVLELLNRELSMTMQLAGVHTVADIRNTALLPAASSYRIGGLAARRAAKKKPRNRSRGCA